MRKFLCFLMPFLLWSQTAVADEKEALQELRQKIWEGYKDGWAVRTATKTSLEAQAHRVYLVTLYKGNEYKFQVVGDKNASDIDLVLHDSEGKEVIRDKSVDREPQFTYIPTDTKTYYVAVHAAVVTEGIEAVGVAFAVTYK
jgi:hypothetical protein